MKISILHSSGTLHTFSGIPGEEVFTWLVLMQTHFQWMQPSRDTIVCANTGWLPYKGTSHKPRGHASESTCLSHLTLPLFQGRCPAMTLWSIKLTSRFQNPMHCLGVHESQVFHSLCVRFGRNRETEIGSDIAGLFFSEFTGIYKQAETKQAPLEFTFHNFLGNFEIPQAALRN